MRFVKTRSFSSTKKPDAEFVNMTRIYYCQTRGDTESVRHFWSHEIPQMLKAGQSLTSLSVKSINLLIGVFPSFDWRPDLPNYWPNLALLSLEKCHITQELEDFIVDRKFTLQSLDLISCSVCMHDGGIMGTPNTHWWHIILKRFEEELTQVTKVNIGSAWTSFGDEDGGPEDDEFMFDMDKANFGWSLNYTCLDEDEDRYVEMQEELPWEGEDMHSLQSFEAAVGVRRQAIQQ